MRGVGGVGIIARCGAVIGTFGAIGPKRAVAVFPREAASEKELFELLDCAYIGARYDLGYKITKRQLEQLTPYVQKLHEVTERNCVAKIESFAR